MLWRILLFLLTIPVAWTFGVEIVGFFFGLIPLVGSTLVTLLAAGGSLTFYLFFVVALVLMWLSVRMFVFSMGFALPQAQRYSATKPVRRFQGAFAEALIFAGIAGVLGALAVAAGIGDGALLREIGADLAPKLREEATREARKIIADSEAALNEPVSLTGPAAAQWSALRAEYMGNLRQHIPDLPASTEYEEGLFPRLMMARYGGNPPFTSGYVATVNVNVFTPIELRMKEIVARAAQGGNQGAQMRIQLNRRVIASAEADYAGPDSPKVVEAARAQLDARPWLERYTTTLGKAWPVLALLGLPLYILFALKGRPATARVYGRVLRFIEAGRFGFGGSARFAALVEEWGAKWRRGEPTLFMGRSLYSRFLHVGLNDPRHMLTIAGSRAGKGTTAIIPNLLTWPGSAIVIDPKGTNAAVTAARRRAMGHDVYVVDPFQVVTKHLGMKESDGFNVFDALDVNSPTIRENIGVIADALVIAEPRAPMQKHWDDGARTVIGGMITHLLTSPNFKGSTLPDIRKLLNQVPAKQAELWADMFQNPAAGGRARDAAGRIINGAGTDEIRNIISNANKNTEFLSSVPVAECLSRSTFNFRQLREKPTTIYLVLPLNVLKDHNRFLRMFINLTILQMAAHGRSPIPVLMVMDEFLTLGHMTEVEKAFVFMAGYNLICWPFIQDYGQLEEIYGASVNSFITNSRAVQVFGISDPKSIGFVSEQIGKRSMRLAWGVDQMRSEWFREPGEVAKEVAINGAAESGPELQYILRHGRAAMLLEKVRYFEKPDLWGRIVKSANPFSGLYGRDPDYGG